MWEQSHWFILWEIMSVRNYNGISASILGDNLNQVFVANMRTSTALLAGVGDGLNRAVFHKGSVSMRRMKNCEVARETD